MENPSTWDALTASLAVCPLSNVERTWQFLLSQLVVLDGPGNMERFQEILKEEKDRGPVTGPSLASRVGSGLSMAGIGGPRSTDADPNGDIAKERFDTWGKDHPE